MADETVEDLQRQLLDKRQELAELRSQRQQAAIDAQAGINKAALRKELENIEGAIEAERALLEAQKNVDQQSVGEGLPAYESSYPSAPIVTDAEGQAPPPPPPSGDSPDTTGEGDK